MIDLYQVLKIDTSLPLDDIQQELFRQEQLWHRREVNSPETATEKLALINQAKKVFASPSSKAAYDRELQESRKKPVTTDPQAERYQQYKKWYADAGKYYHDQKYDLAKIAIENALSNLDPHSATAEFYGTVASIYRESGDYQLALDYINKAIVLQSDDPSLYVGKGLIYGAWYENSNSDSKEKEKKIIDERNAYKDAVTVSNSQGSKDTLSIAYGCLSYSYYRGIWGKEGYYAQMGMSADGQCLPQHYLPNEIKEAEQYATLALECGDVWGYGEKILSRIESIHQKQKENTTELKNKVEETKRRESLFGMLEDAFEQQSRVSEASIQSFFASLDVSSSFREHANHLIYSISRGLVEKLIQGENSLKMNVGGLSFSRNSELGRQIERQVGFFHSEDVKKQLIIELNKAGVHMDFESIYSLWHFNLSPEFRWRDIYYRELKELCAKEGIDLVSMDNVGYFIVRAQKELVHKAIEKGIRIPLSTLNKIEKTAEEERERNEFSEKINGNKVKSKADKIALSEGERSLMTNKNINLKETRKQKGLCQYCGGQFKGLFIQKCTRCGKKKDY